MGDQKRFNPAALQNEKKTSPAFAALAPKVRADEFLRFLLRSNSL